MATISQETWDNMSEEEKKKIRTDYHNYNVLLDTKSMTVLENTFGKENLQSKPKIRTWEDVKAISPSLADFKVETPVGGLYDMLHDKLIATYKLGILIELGYGGMVTEEEWCSDIIKHCAVRHESEIQHTCMINAYEFIAFHTIEQYEEFMSHKSNIKLVEQYNMI